MFIALFADGGSRGNPGPSAFGYLIVETQNLSNLEKLSDIKVRTEMIETGEAKIVSYKGKYIGDTTNNQAEWQGLVFAIQEICDTLNSAEINLVAYLDSELVVKQVRGEYKVKNLDLKPWFLKVTDFLKEFKSYKIQHVYREHNKEADKMVNQILDEM